MTEDGPPRAFLLLHGWQNRRPAGHWQHWLAAELGTLGHTVDYPQLPDPDRPDLGRWLTELRMRLAGPRTAPLTVICHSLACALWLHAAVAPEHPEARPELTPAATPTPAPAPVDRALLVAPPSPGFLRQHPEVAAFAPPPVTRAQLSAAAGHTRIVASDNDPCCPEGAVPAYGRPLGLPTTTLPSTAHLNPAAGYGPWPSLLNWCLAPTADTPIGPAPA
ncbi:RBBP9/YdeN family alpha/beta hydrolase [Streptomyces sp. NBC_00448]|uniref:RBBP9/YdeN family alpha/beta hydrolase n=1 Tax=Streptomyces sp. NBC_00448 TaxID=2903652 RepID=UPI002E240AF3